MSTWTAPQLPKGTLSLLQAIAKVEGYYARFDADGKRLTAPNRSQRNHNPGDLEYKPWQKLYGATLETGTPHPRFASFPTAERGFAALECLLKSSIYNCLTLAAAINRFAPPCENNTAGYVAKVCKWTGLPAGQMVGEALA